MKKTLSYLFFISTIMFISCEPSSDEYSDEELETLEEAQKIHNEAIAIFAETRPLLADLTEVRSELMKRTEIEVGDTGKIKSDTVDKSRGLDTARQEDTTNILSPEMALHQLNQAQANMLEWMRDIYQVPHFPPIYEDEKAGKKPGIGTDFDSNLLLTDMEFKQYPEGTSPEEILESQKKMRDDILKTQRQLKQVITEARRAYIYGDFDKTGTETGEGTEEETEEGGEENSETGN